MNKDTNEISNSGNAKEIFECSIQTAIDAVKKAIELYK
jgi:hypothetical protein